MAWCEIQLYFNNAVITEARPVLGKEQLLEEVGREINTIKSGLGNVGSSVEGKLPGTRVEMSKAVCVVHVFD